MELTDDMLRRIAKHMVDLWSDTRALEIIVVEQLKGDPRRLEELKKEYREKPEYQSQCNHLFEQLKNDR